ncbi:MAG: hypothetical protein Q7T71_02245 [Herbiconiux sp.]|nr:hypothetical protein [Herbiconiux sp.]
MTDVTEEARVTAAADRAMLPGAAVIARIRRMIVVVFIAGLAYGALITAGKSICVGGVDGAGGSLDSSGAATDAATTCLTLTLGPSPLMIIAFAVIVVIALTRVLKRSTSERDALKTLDRAVVVVVALAVTGIVVSQAWFALIPISDWRPTGSFSFFSPFPLGSVDLSITPGPAT